MQDKGWKAFFPLEYLGNRLMVIFIDVYGNEAREIVNRDSLVTVTEETKPKKNKKVRG
jgi:hypothetical protein